MAASSSSSTPLLYSCIAHNSTILTEHTASVSSQTSSIPSLVLPKIEHSSPQKLSYIHGSNYVHFIAESPSEYPSSSLSAGGLTFLVIAPQSLGRRIPFGYLVEIKKQFLDKFDGESTDFGALPAYGCGSFNKTLKDLMVKFGTTQAGKNDAIGNVQAEIDDVRHIMTENIERVLERGERIDTLVHKTDRLGSSATDFRMRSRNLRRRMWWKNVKLMALLGVVVIFLLYLFIGFGCGLPAWSKCTGK